MLKNNIKLILTFIALLLIIYIFYQLVINKKKTKEHYGVISDCKFDVNHVMDEYVDCDWELGKLLGSGKKGDTYEASCKTYPNMNFAIKEQKYIDENTIRKEATNQLMAGTTITPDVYDAFTCGSDGYIVTDKLNYSIFDYLKNKSPEVQNTLISNFQKQAITKFLEAAARGIVHKDTHIENMMINEDENGNPILYFIDWGYADRKTLSDKEIKDKKIDIEQTFDLLRSNLSNPSYNTKTPAAPKGKKQFKRIFDSEPLYKTSYLFDESPNKKTNSPSNYSSLSTSSKGLNNLNSLFSNFNDDDENDYEIKRNISFSTPKKSNNLFSAFDEIAEDTPKKSNNLFRAFDEINEDDENDEKTNHIKYSYNN